MPETFNLVQCYVFAARESRFPKTGHPVTVYEFVPGDRNKWELVDPDDRHDLYFLNAEDRDRYLSEKWKRGVKEGSGWHPIDTYDLDANRMVYVVSPDGSWSALVRPTKEPVRRFGIRYVPERWADGIPEDEFLAAVRRAFSYDVGKSAVQLRDLYAESCRGWSSWFAPIPKPWCFEGWSCYGNRVTVHIEFDCDAWPLKTVERSITYAELAKIINEEKRQLSFFQ